MKKPKPYIRSVELRDGFDKRAYPFNIPAVANMGTLEFHEDVTFFVGENGSGKSTILEGIALSMGLAAQGGNKNFMLADAGGTSGLDRYVKAVKSYQAPKEYFFFRAESFYNVATYAAEVGSNFGSRGLHHQSHGESFMAMLVDKLRGKGLYLFDEPEAALSPARQLAALVRIHDLVRTGSQFIIATHSPILLSYPSAKIIRFGESGLQDIEYEHTEHYSITRDFLNNYQKRLNQLFSDD